MPVNYEWTSKKRNLCEKCKSLEFEVSTHPLKLLVTAGSSKSFIDNLNKWSAAFEEVDPLLRFEQISLEEGRLTPKDEIKMDYLIAWNNRRPKILNKYTTGEKLTIVSSFLPGGEKTLIRQVSFNLNEKVKNRLEQLDDFDEGSIRKTIGLSQQEYISKIAMLSDEIKKAWDSEQKVTAFKIAIQCSKLLSDVTAMHFYPSKFVLITDILLEFGQLVFERLNEKSFGKNNKKEIHEIDSRQVPNAAKETCQNWFFKMASIRELLPRLYMEMSLLKCYAFLNKDDIKSAISRLTIMIRGVGNPLVAVYLRLHLCNISASLLDKECAEYFYANLIEFIEEYQQVFHPSLQNKYEVQLLTREKYLNLYVPAVEWMLYGSINFKQCKLTLLEELLDKCAQIENNELLLSCLVSSFESEFVVQSTDKILDISEKVENKNALVCEALTQLGNHLCKSGVPRGVSAATLLQRWWRLASEVTAAPRFLQLLEPWIQFAAVSLSSQHVNMILRGAIRYLVKCGQGADELAGPLQAIAKRLLAHVLDVQELLLMDAFMPLVELVQTSAARTMMAKTVLASFFERHSTASIDDPVVITSLMRSCCILHDSINAVSVDDEIKLCSDLINKFVLVVTYHDDWEHQLDFYVECRSSFIRLDLVLVTLVHLVNGLSIRASSLQGKWLQRACAAYSFITVPSLRCTITKSQLYLASGQVALANNCIGQAEANFKALITLIPDIPEYLLEDGQKKSTNFKTEAILSDFLSTMLLMPDNIESDCKAYVLSGFIKTLERIHWRKTDALYYNTLLRTLDLLSHMTRENYVHHMDSVLSNDKLYGSEPEFINTIDSYASNICEELLVVLKALGEAKETKKQYSLALELFWRVIKRSDLSAGAMMTLAINLWALAQKVQDCSNKYSWFIWMTSNEVLSNEDNQGGFVQPLDFSSIFQPNNPGIASLISHPVATAMLSINNNNYPHLFDTIVSSSIDSLQRRTVPKDNKFSPSHFGFNPIASQGFLAPKSARLVKNVDQNYHQIPEHRATNNQYNSPLKYDIRTVHDPYYNNENPEDIKQGETYSQLKNDPTIEPYFKQQVTKIEVSHPVNYRKEEQIENLEANDDYKPNPYVSGSSRIRRYSGKNKKNIRKDSEEDDSYDYASEYSSKPKAFNGKAYSAYKEEKDPNKDYEYPYDYDSGYDHKEYERIKELSENQAAEIKQNPGNCKEVKKDDLTCMVCKDPKTGGNYESCSYVAEPKNNQYAYSKEKKFDSNDAPNNPENDAPEAPIKPAKYQEIKDEQSEERYPAEQERAYDKESAEDDSKGKNKAYYVHTSKPKAKLRKASDEDVSEENSDTLTKPYNYKEALPEFYSNNEPKKDVEHVLAEFKKKDRSACKKVQKNGMTCFQCTDKNGLKHEECMYVSESAPKKSHLQYQELKEFNSKPLVQESGSEGAESQTVTTNAPIVPTSYVVANNNYGKKIKRKKVATHVNPIPESSVVAPLSQLPIKVYKRSAHEEEEERAKIVDQSNIAAPEAFAGAESHGAFWSETKPRYSAALGVTLPEYMLSRSEHEASFDETVAGV